MRQAAASGMPRARQRSSETRMASGGAVATRLSTSVASRVSMMLRRT